VTLIVLDASVVAAWYLPGQRTDRADDLLDEANLHRFTAPHIFPIEVANVFLMAERRRGVTPRSTAVALASLAGLNLSLTPTESLQTVPALLELARAEGLTSYDAQYLQLSIGAACTLASRDRPLLAAAARRGVPTMDLNP
jgi:predicted nucleic acid-binding protein